MKRKTRKHNGRRQAALTLLLALLALLWPQPAAAATSLSPTTVSFTLIRPAPERLELLTVLTFSNDTGATVPEVRLPLPAGYEDIAFAVPALAPDQLEMSSTNATAHLPLAAGETRQYVYRATLPLPNSGTRLDLALPWPAPDVLVLVDGSALHALPGAEFAPAGTVDIEGRSLTAYRRVMVSAGETIGLAVSPGSDLTALDGGVRPTRWERLQANLSGRPAAFLGLIAAVAVALWATSMWRQQHRREATLAAERRSLIRRIASLDVQAAGAGDPPTGYGAERERLLARLEAVARRLGEDGQRLDGHLGEGGGQ